MYYIINPLTWPFTIIPNLPQNLIEVIDSPIPLLIGILGNESLAKEIDKLRGGDDNIVIIENDKFKYFKEEKLVFNTDSLLKLKHSLEKNYLELKIEKNKSINNLNFRIIIEKIYKNIHASIKEVFCKKIDFICDKYKDQLRKSVLGTNIDSLSSQELELRQKIKDEFSSIFSDFNKKNDFYKIFSQTQIFSAYLDRYIENNKK